MSLKEFQLIKKLGEGAYSSVYQVIRSEDNLAYALKKVKLAILSPKERENALNQVRILASVNHPSIICYKQAFIDETSKSLCIVMQYANEGDLCQKIDKNIQQEKFMQQKYVWSAFLQMIQGLKALHEMGIFHRDIKPANVFIFDNGAVKLGDMNVSKVSQRGLCMTQTGTPYYASPEVWKDQPYDSKSDIWSIGCVLYQMVTLKPPFRANDMEGLYKKVVRGIYPRIPQNYSNELADLIRALLQVNPKNRPSCQQILKMSSMIKRMSPNKQRESKLSERNQLLRTIRAGENIYEISNQLPKANYNFNQNRKYSKSKVIKNIPQIMGEEKQQMVYQTLRAGGGSINNQMIDSLPYLQKEAKIRVGQSSERPLVRKRSKAKVEVVQKKRSHTDCDRDMDLLHGLHYHYQNVKESAIKEKQRDLAQKDANNQSKRQIKLPKVANRYNRELQKIRKERSLKVHRLH